jgi:hypothetical protein
MLPFRLIVIFAGFIAIGSMQVDFNQPSTTHQNLTLASASPQLGQDLLNSPLSLDDQTKIQSISASEWLGPLAPVAISPFFGITCLAGLSQFGSDYLPLNNFISNNAVLKNQYVLWVFMGLTLLTSLPRLTKVSKPFAQAMDMLETYGGIITIIILRFASAVPVEPDAEVAMAATYMQMGWMTFPTDVMFSIAAIINIIVINSVKFFFEVLVWLVPFPFVDALLEIANKSICAGLMAIYAYSPMLATILNLVLFAACLYVFNWARRRVTYWRTMLTDLLIVTVWPSYGKWKGKSLIGFVSDGVDSIPAKSKVALERTDLGWRLTEQRMFFPGRVVDLPKETFSFELCRGLVTNRIRNTAIDEEPIEIVVSCRHKKQLDQIAAQFSFSQADCPVPQSAAMEL